jgi:hypothetical protein
LRVGRPMLECVGRYFPHPSGVRGPIVTNIHKIIKANS